MDIKDFLANFAEQFEETEKSFFTPQVEFKSLNEWDSLIAMAIIGMSDASYNVKLTGDDIRNSKTIEDLFEIINNRIQ